MSYSKGHSMKMVARGPQDGAKLVEVFGGDRKKKVFLYFSSGTHNASSSSSTSVASSSSQSTIPSTHNTSTSSSTTAISSSIFSTSTTSSTTSTASSTASTISSTLASSTTSSTTFSITSTTPATHTMMIDLTTPPTGGVPTRRYLTALASQGGSSSDMYGDINSDESDDDQNNIDTQGAILNNYGYVTDDFTTAGVVSDDHTILSRTSEVLQCSEVFTGDAGETAIFPFVTHSFEEICWQAYDDRRPIVLLLFNPLAPSQFRATMHSFLQKVRNESKQDFYFWPAETTSKHGQGVVEKYGSGRGDQIVFLVPSTQQSPVVVDCIDGPALKDFDSAKLCQRINNMIEGLSMEREQLEQWRQLRREQEIELDQMALTSQHHNVEVCSKQESPEQANTNVSEEEEQPKINVMEKEIEKEIREARLARNSQEPTHGHTIRVRTPTGVVSRKFGVASHYQEVYDWVGAQYEMPLHFTLHSCRGTSEDDAVILHGQLILADETVNLTERDEQEVSTLLKDQVSFKGNYQGLVDLSKTTVDEGSKEKEDDTTEETDRPNVENAKQKRKRKDNRAPKDRRKKQKKESKEVQN